MNWVIIGLAMGAVALVGLIVVAAARRDATSPEDADPLLIAGIAVSGTGAALTATLWPSSLAILALGMMLLVLGIIRTRRGRGGS